MTAGPRASLCILVKQLTSLPLESYISSQSGRPGNSEMSLTLGEKLRQAREERGFTLSEVAEQTRISSLYLESIENDDYKILPGGIFNKGFVKSFAKFVGVNEQEALADYTKMISLSELDTDDLKVYRPEVLTDDRSGASMAPTIIIAIIILALMTGGILFLLNYLRQPDDGLAINAATSNTDTTTNMNTDPPPTDPLLSIPEMGSVKVEFRALSEPVSLTATNDGKASTNVVTAGSSVEFEPKESLKLSYSRSLAKVVALTINGKEITLPTQPLAARRNTIEFVIDKDNLASIWESGAIGNAVSEATPAANATVEASATPPPPRPVTTPVRRSTLPAPTNVNRPAPSPRPTDRVRSVPTPSPKVIIVPSANRP
jgi:cytoskeletal protein RodZ